MRARSERREGGVSVLEPKRKILEIEIHPQVLYTPDLTRYHMHQASTAVLYKMIEKEYGGRDCFISCHWVLRPRPEAKVGKSYYHCADMTQNR